MEISPSSPITQARSSFEPDIPHSPPVALHDAVVLSRGDLIFGLSTTVQAYERYPSWTPSRIAERLLVAAGMVSERPEAHTFVGMTAGLDKNGVLVQKALKSQLHEAMAAVKVAGHRMEKAEPPIDSFDQEINGIFGSASNSFTRNTMDKLSDQLRRRPDRAPSQSLMQAARAVIRGEENVVHDFSTLIFARMSKSLIDAFVSQVESGAIQSKNGGANDLARIHFLLDDIRMEDVVAKSGEQPRGTTAKELRYMYRIRDRIGDAVKFYLNGSQVDAPWVENAPLWDTYPHSERDQILDSDDASGGRSRISTMSEMSDYDDDSVEMANTYRGELELSDLVDRFVR